MRICIPTRDKNGLKAEVHAHFGSANYFIIYDTDSNSHEVIENTNIHHSHGMCHPLSVLGGNNIDAVVCSGMGLRAIQKLSEGGIKAYRVNAATVEEVIEHYNNNSLELLTPENACSEHKCD